MSVIPVMLGGLAVGGSEDPVEIADILVAHGNGNIGNVPICTAQQESGLRKALFLHQLGVGLAGFLLQLPGQPAKVIMQQLCRLGQGAGDIVAFHIA